MKGKCLEKNNHKTLIDTEDVLLNTPFVEGIPNTRDWHKGICEMLLEAGADLHAPDGDDETPLHWAAKHGPVEALEFLLSRGARTDLKDNQGKLPIDVADTEEKRTILLKAME